MILTFFPSSLREDLLKVIERQNYEMTALKKDLTDIKRLLAQTVVQGQLQTTASVPTSEMPVRDSAKSPGTSKPRKHHGKALRKGPQDSDTNRATHESDRSTSLPQLDSRQGHTATGTSSLPGIDIRRQPARDVALVAPRKESETNGSAC